MLIIVDMQRHFLTEFSDYTLFVKQVTKVARRAMQLSETIICLEYADCGITIDPLQALLAGYPNLHVVTKDHDNGATDIIKAMVKKQLTADRFRICGVRSDACVAKTIYGLSDYGVPIEVLWNHVRPRNNKTLKEFALQVYAKGLAINAK